MSKLHLTSSKSLKAGGTVKRGTPEEAAAIHLKGSADRAIKQLLSQRFGGSAVDLLEMSCQCGSAEPHPRTHWAVIVVGPYRSREEVLNTVEELGRHKAEIIKSDDALRRMRDRNITGG